MRRRRSGCLGRGHLLEMEQDGGVGAHDDAGESVGYLGESRA